MVLMTTRPGRVATRQRQTHSVPSVWTGRDVTADRCNPIFRSYTSKFRGDHRSDAAGRLDGLAGQRGANLVGVDCVIADSRRTGSPSRARRPGPGRQLGELFRGAACELRDAGRRRLIEYHTFVDGP